MEFSLQEYRHTCRTCRDLEQVVTQTKNPNTNHQFKYLNLNTNAVDVHSSEKQLRQLPCEQHIRIILIL